MTPASPIPEDLLRFLEANVDSIEQLELLRVLGEHPIQEHNAADLARECQIKPSSIAAELTALEHRGLLKTRSQDPHLFCSFNPAPSTDGLLKRLLQFYREHPVILIKVVYARAQDRLKAFADAFRLRKEG